MLAGIECNGSTRQTVGNSYPIDEAPHVGRVVTLGIFGGDNHSRLCLANFLGKLKTIFADQRRAGLVRTLKKGRPRCLQAATIALKLALLVSLETGCFGSRLWTLSARQRAYGEPGKAHCNSQIPTRHLKHHCLNRFTPAASSVKGGSQFFAWANELARCLWASLAAAPPVADTSGVGATGLADSLVASGRTRGSGTLEGVAAGAPATVKVGTNASHFAAGDLALIDQVDDSTVQEGDCQYFKRVDKRSVSERVEIASIDTTAGTVTLTTPLHWTFKSASPYLAQIAKASGTIIKWAGIDSIALTGGTNPGYDGQMAGGIDISNAAYCWVKDVQTDGTIGGMHVSMKGTYRCVVRDGHFHNSANYGFGADCYGLVLRCGAADNLIENNIVRYMNKPIMFNVSGGGNVIGYNYADNSWATPSAWQEVNIDTHCSFPHMELMEGNYAPHMGATITHGNAGYLTYFRNYSSSQFAPPAVYGATDKQTGNIVAIQFDTGDINMTVIGNVLGSTKATDLGTAPVSTTYVGTDSNTPSIFQFGGSGKSDVSYTSLWWHGNYDTVTPGVLWNPAIATQVLPASLYLSAKPAWWPASNAWPWAGSDLSPRVGTLPAKARSDSL